MNYNEMQTYVWGEMSNELRASLLDQFIDGRVLVTGGTGFLGGLLVRVLLQLDTKYLRIFSRDEHKQAAMRLVLVAEGYDLHGVRFILGDVRDVGALESAMRGIDFVFHLAALKSIYQLEYAPLEALKTNVHGTWNVVSSAIKNRVKKIVYSSTDKAVMPINAYGASKAMAEKLIIRANVYIGEQVTKFCCTRFGNILGSTGSVIPLFNEQRHTGTIQITDHSMTRFVLTGLEAVETLLEALEVTDGGEIFIRRCPSVTLPTLAKAFCATCEQERIGVRPGEKFHEMLIAPEEMTRTVGYKGDYFVILPFPKIREEYKWVYPPTPIGTGPYVSNDNIMLTWEDMNVLLQSEGLI